MIISYQSCLKTINITSLQWKLLLKMKNKEQIFFYQVNWISHESIKIINYHNFVKKNVF